ncbi:hypothetical protein [Nonomuraea sp. NPDC050643]|uniref:hypothetical protein n=1 Tax=Nonomuraea sp. NPDC050643 TaxID=3155660 RepID=UPI0033F62BC5
MYRPRPLNRFHPDFFVTCGIDGRPKVNRAPGAVRRGGMASRLFALFALVAALLAGTSTAAHACSCAQMTPARSVEQATAVFTGTVVAVRTDDARPPAPSVFTFRADNVYKGTPAAEFTLASDVDSASCGYAFEKGTRYLVFASAETSAVAGEVPGVGLSSSLCAGNVPVEPGTGPLRPGDERTPGHTSLAGPIDAAMIAALGTPKTTSEIAPSAVRPPAGSRSWILPGLALAGAFLAIGIATLVVRRRRTQES